VEDGGSASDARHLPPSAAGCGRCGRGHGHC